MKRKRREQKCRYENRGGVKGTETEEDEDVKERVKLNQGKFSLKSA